MRAGVGSRPTAAGHGFLVEGPVNFESSHLEAGVCPDEIHEAAGPMGATVVSVR